MFRHFPLYLFICIFIISACNSPKVALEGIGYFDIGTFVDELKAGGTNKKGIEKTVSVNGKKETKSLEEYDIAQELELLRKYNINKANLAGKYSVDSISVDGILVTTYKALEDKLLTQSLIIKKKGEELKELVINGRQKSILSESKLTIIFAPENQYHLLSEDNNKYSKDLVKEILINF